MKKKNEKNETKASGNYLNVDTTQSSEGKGCTSAQKWKTQGDECTVVVAMRWHPKMGKRPERVQHCGKSASRSKVVEHQRTCQLL